MTLGPIYEGLRVVASGLKADDRVVLDGLANPASVRERRSAEAGQDQKPARMPHSEVVTRSTAESPMRLSHFFIDRPIFASVLSMIIMIVG